MAEGAGATATVKFHDGADTTGAVAMTINLAGNESVTDFYDGKVIEFANGLYIEFIGTVAGSVFTEGG